MNTEEILKLATPRPWRALPHDNNAITPYDIAAPWEQRHKVYYEPEIVRCMRKSALRDPAEANQKLILMAVNLFAAHEAVAEAAKAFLEAADQVGVAGRFFRIGETQEQLRSAIAALEQLKHSTH